MKERAPGDVPVWVEVTPSGGTTNTQWSTPTPRANGKYQFSVKACNDYGCSDESTLTQTVQVTVQIPAPTPTTPAHFTAYPSAQAGNPIRFFWGAVAGADRYELQESLITCRRTNDPVNFQFAANAAPPFTRRAALAKCAGQEQDPSTYQYVIRACNGSNCSAWSTDVVTTEVGSVPTGPESTTTTTFIHTDGLRSPVVETTASGAVKTRVRYEPYGATRLPATQGPGYAGHVTDEKTGLSYMQQRYYDPIAGRFLSIDPVSADAGSFNRYWYANNNPYKYIDPDGRESVGEMIDRNAQGAADAGNRLATYGWAFARTAWDYLGAEGISQVADKGSSAGAGNGAMAALEVATLGKGGAVLKAGEQIAEGAAKLSIKGITGHAVDQAINRGVKPAQILDAVRNPLKVAETKVDSLGRQSQKIVGEKATVVVNPETGKIVTVYPTSTKAAEKLLEKKK